ncbi:MAG: HAMP domain-containing histidine kinase [Nitrospirae bacterium]|nr:HAMP domain-containing histidine kinase [Nitrospirota bacterium]MBI3593955.1 HAMP domain-containing histidine kinase [Nitrospirota bacterium]
MPKVKQPLHPLPLPKKGLLLKFIVSYTILIGAVFLGGGWLLFYHVKNALDEELSKRIIGISEIVSATTSPAYLKKIGPGDEHSYLYNHLLDSIKKIQEKSHVNDIFIFDQSNRIIIDSDEEVPIGNVYQFLKLDQTELEEVWNGKTSSSILYKGKDGKFYKSGYAPIFDDQGQIFAVAGVEAGADFLEILTEFRRNIFLPAFLIFLFIIIVSWLISRSIINPIKQLVASMDRIGKEQDYAKVLVTTEDEIGFLSSRFNDMIDHISEKDALLNERVATLERMSATVAHEIRNPLGAIELNAEFLERKTGDEKLKVITRTIIEEVKNLNGIVTDFLAFSKEPRLNRTPVALEPFLQKIIQMACAAHKEIPVKAKLEIPPDFPLIEIDENEFRKALLNITLNAIESMPEGGNLSISVTLQERKCTLILSDTGHGIPDTVKSMIFNPFFTTKESGTGLGLAIAHKIIAGHQGTLSFLSQVNKGTDFVITIPLRGGQKNEKNINS